jgi:RNA polymerase sigma-70 factor (ECF subfamily)
VSAEPEELLARVARQDVAALSELYDRYAPRVYGLLARVLPSSSPAEEILEGVFVRLWTESPTVSRGGGSVAAWLVVTARAAALDWLRAARIAKPSEARDDVTRAAEKRPPTRKSKASAPLIADPRNSEARRSRTANRIVSLVPSFLPPAALPTPEAIAKINDRQSLLLKSIKELPKAQSRALELAVFGGLSESEIAVAMNEPLAKAQRSLRAAVSFVKHRRQVVCGSWAANI